jgi:hypothetical protein
MTFCLPPSPAVAVTRAGAPAPGRSARVATGKSTGTRRTSGGPTGGPVCKRSGSRPAALGGSSSVNRPGSRTTRFAWQMTRSARSKGQQVDGLVSSCLPGRAARPMTLAFRGSRTSVTMPAAVLCQRICAIASVSEPSAVPAITVQRSTVDPAEANAGLSQQLTAEEGGPDSRYPWPRRIATPSSVAEFASGSQMTRDAAGSCGATSRCARSKTPRRRLKRRAWTSRTTASCRARRWCGDH